MFPAQTWTAVPCPPPKLWPWDERLRALLLQRIQRFAFSMWSMAERRSGPSLINTTGGINSLRTASGDGWSIWLRQGSDPSQCWNCDNKTSYSKESHYYEKGANIEAVENHSTEQTWYEAAQAKGEDPKKSLALCHVRFVEYRVNVIRWWWNE